MKQANGGSKRAGVASPEATGIGSHGDRTAGQALLERAVTFCIDEFYRST